MVFLISFTFYAQRDTAQVVIGNRQNAPEVLAKPYVILITTDGFRSDYAEKYQAKNILSMKQRGVSAAALIPSYPSITFPNHWTLITGLYPSHHGLVDNNFYDYNRNKSYSMGNLENVEDGSWYGGMPLWSSAEKQGMLAASLMWPGSTTDAGGIRPTYYYHYQEKWSPDEKVDKVINWLKLPPERRPHFITLYFPDVDSSGHYFGPDSPETEKAVQMVDAAVGKLQEKIQQLGLRNVNIIFLSDHGMVEVDRENPLEIPAMLLDKNRFDFVNSQTLLRITVKNPAEILPVFRELKKHKTRDYEVYLAKRFPRKLKYATRDDRYNRMGQIYLLPKVHKIFLQKNQKTTIGKHGYNPYKVPEMKATFIASGPQFKQSKTIGEFKNVNLYPIVAEILGLKITTPIDGKSCTAKKILK